MKLDYRIAVFVKLGQKIENLSEEEWEETCTRARNENAWFSADNVKRAMASISHMLHEECLKQWLSQYDLSNTSIKNIGIIMAGNIPLVGFHDLLCVCISGHHASVKLSKDDSYLSSLVISWIKELDTSSAFTIDIVDRLNSVDAVIATGSDNSARYFEYYFRNKPKIIRKNRTSVAVITSQTSYDELALLGKDIFWYFGLGCRNVSKLLIERDFNLKLFFEAIEAYEPVIHHHKYRNNYDYHKSIFLVNGDTHLDNGFLLLRETNDLVSPLSVLYYERFESYQNIEEYLSQYQEKIQCVVGNKHIPFGDAQIPKVWDYADNVDTLRFCIELT